MGASPNRQVRMTGHLRGEPACHAMAGIATVQTGARNLCVRGRQGFELAGRGVRGPAPVAPDQGCVARAPVPYSAPGM